MLRQLAIAIPEAFNTLKGNLFRTILSTLGIVIGVGALISILALGDGMERYGREQIASTTSLSAVLIQPVRYKSVEGINMPNENLPVLSCDDVLELSQLLGREVNLQASTNTQFYFENKETGNKKPAVVIAALHNQFSSKNKILHGIRMDSMQIVRRDSVIMLNKNLARRLAADSNNIESMLGKSLRLGSRRLRVIGIFEVDDDMQKEVSSACIPLFVLTKDELKERPLRMVANAVRVEEVEPMKKKIENWFDQKYTGGKSNFEFLSNDFRLNQVKEAIMIFKVVMGLIVGIAILVGGIGVMNVLLMSITERTREIGIRKALGAKKRVIALQFLSESLAVSILGCILGMLLGILFMSIVIPLIKHLTEIEFPYAFSFGSFGLVALVATLIGLVFGTYPALKASKLSPVDAIRHE